MTERKTTPIWLLDVDGVLNALPDWSDDPLQLGGWDDLTETHAAPAGGRKYTIMFSPKLIAEINALHEVGAVEVRWLTTWGRGANGELREKLGLPEFPVAGEPDVLSGFAGAPNHRWWKFDDARRAYAAEPHRPFIWTDDDLRYVDDALKWAGDNGFLAISTNIRTGITPANLERIKNFIHSQNAMVA